MENKSVNRGLAGWIEDFVSGLAKKAGDNPAIDTEKEEGLVEAEININDLDKVVWKDEAFRVHFDQKGANLINEFGNVVTTLPGVTSIEEVDKRLNGSEIVTAEDEEEVVEAGTDELGEELDKLAASLGEEQTEDGEVVAEGEGEEVIADELGGEEVVASEDDKEDPVMTAIIAGFEELDKRIAAVEQLYARNPQLTDVDNHSQDEELKHVQDADKSSQEGINREHNIDLTSPAGRVELSQQHSEVEQIVTEDTTPETDTTEVDTDVDAPEVDLEKEDDNDDVEVGIDVDELGNDLTDATDEETEDTNTDVETQDSTETDEDKTETEDKGDEDSVEDSKEDTEDKEEEKAEKLSGAAEKIFQKGICPETGEELVKSRTAGNFLGVYSPKGGTEYAVNLKTGEIFKHKK
jgi:hypothetical protein